MSILGQPQRQRCTPPEIQLSMFRQVQSVKTGQNLSFRSCGHAPHWSNLSLFQEQLHSDFTPLWIQSSVESPVVHHRVEPLHCLLGPTDPIHRHHLRGKGSKRSVENRLPPSKTDSFPLSMRLDKAVYQADLHFQLDISICGQSEEILNPYYKCSRGKLVKSKDVNRQVL